MATATVAAAAPVESKSSAALMESVADRNQLLTEVAATARVADGKSTQPLLSHLLFRTNARGALSITGSDLKRTVTTECPAAVTTPGEATVPAQKLLNYLKLLPGGKVSMKLLANHQMQVTSGRSRTRMPGLSPNSFPPAPSARPHRCVSVRVA